MSNNSSSNSGGVGFFGLLGIVFITLKLTDSIDWSWWWVTAPLWIPFTLFMAYLLMVALYFLFKK